MSEEQIPEESKKPWKFGNRFLDFTIVFGVLAILVIMALYPDYKKNKIRAIKTGAQSHLKNLYLGCKAYWAEQGSEQECWVDIVTSAEYGFVQSTRVSIYGKGTETTFTATAQHMDSTTSYTMDSNGRIE